VYRNLDKSAKMLGISRIAAFDLIKSYENEYLDDVRASIEDYFRWLEN